MERKKKEGFVASNTFVCCDEEFTPAEVIEHLKEVHYVAPGTVGTRRVVRHIDGKEFYASVYLWQFGDIMLTQSVSSPRAKDDIMRMGE